MQLMRVAWPLLASLACAQSTATDVATIIGTPAPSMTASSTADIVPTRLGVPGSATASSSSVIATHTVMVGPKTAPHSYVPHSIYANVGDIILFEFYPTNHSVAKADYLAPCVPAGEGEFYSGNFNEFKYVNGQPIGPPPTWSLVVNDSSPTFFYCTAINSCTGYGMVGVINPTSTETWQKQRKKALSYPFMVVPGQPMPAEGSGGTSTSKHSHSSSTTSTASSRMSMMMSSNNSSSEGGLSSGAIAGIVVACVVFVGIVVALFFVMGRNRVYQQWMSSQDGRNERTARRAMLSSQTPSWLNKQSGLDSKHPKKPLAEVDAAEVTSFFSPESALQGFSPQPGSMSTGPSPQTHRSWENPHMMRRPTELEAHSIVRPPSKTGR